MARNVKSTYKIQFPINSKSSITDSVIKEWNGHKYLNDISKIDKNNYYPTFTGTAEEVSNILGCSPRSVNSASNSHMNLKKCKVIGWTRYVEHTPYGIINTKTNKLRVIDGESVFPLYVLANKLHYNETYIYKILKNQKVGKNIWENEQIIPINNAIIRHYVIWDGKDSDFYQLYIDDKLECELQYA